MVINAKRANEEVGERRSPAIPTVTGDGNEYFKKGSTGLSLCIPVECSIITHCQVQKIVCAKEPKSEILNLYKHVFNGLLSIITYEHAF